VLASRPRKVVRKINTWAGEVDVTHSLVSHCAIMMDNECEDFKEEIILPARQVLTTEATCLLSGVIGGLERWVFGTRLRDLA